MVHSILLFNGVTGRFARKEVSRQEGERWGSLFCPTAA
ncbi:UNVERIFIED_CONTAM: hypothetical protein C7383_1121, partial [Murimonas intestini]